MQGHDNGHILSYLRCMLHCSLSESKSAGEGEQGSMYLRYECLQGWKAPYPRSGSLPTLEPRAVLDITEFFVTNPRRSPKLELDKRYGLLSPVQVADNPCQTFQAARVIGMGAPWRMANFRKVGRCRPASGALRRPCAPCWADKGERAHLGDHQGQNQAVNAPRFGFEYGVQFGLHLKHAKSPWPRRSTGIFRCGADVPCLDTNGLGTDGCWICGRAFRSVLAADEGRRDAFSSSQHGRIRLVGGRARCPWSGS